MSSDIVMSYRNVTLGFSIDITSIIMSGARRKTKTNKAKTHRAKIITPKRTKDQNQKIKMKKGQKDKIPKLIRPKPIYPDYKAEIVSGFTPGL